MASPESCHQVRMVPEGRLCSERQAELTGELILFEWYIIVG